MKVNKVWDALQDTAVILGREQGRLAEESEAAAAAAGRAAAVLQVSHCRQSGQEGCYVGCEWDFGCLHFGQSMFGNKAKVILHRVYRVCWDRNTASSLHGSRALGVSPLTKQGLLEFQQMQRCPPGERQ